MKLITRGKKKTEKQSVWTASFHSKYSIFPWPGDLQSDDFRLISGLRVAVPSPPPPKVKRKLFPRLYFTLAGGGCSYTLASWSTSEKTSIQKQLADYRAAKFLLNRKSKLKE